MERIIYTYYLLFEYFYFHDKMKSTFFQYWRKAWRNYYVRANWFEQAREIHEREVKELQA